MSLDLEFPIWLPGGGVFRFSGTFPMPCEQWQYIQQVMDAMAPGLVAMPNKDSDECSPPVATHTAPRAGSIAHNVSAEVTHQHTGR